MQRRELFRRIIVKVIQENRLDILIQLHSPLPPGKIGLAPEPEVNDRGFQAASKRRVSPPAFGPLPGEP
ncbi:MAG: hypothetical protein AB7O32_17725 [Vicinamibacterales bacterium]